MPRDKTESHRRILEAAKREFLEYGFADASLRRIASNAQIQVSGLYKHFSNKAEMFEAIMDPVVKGFYSLYSVIEEEYFTGIEKLSQSREWKGQSEAVRVMKYIYDHAEEFLIIISKSQGTKYEEFTHEVARLEEEVTLRYVEELKKAGFAVKGFDKKEFHLLVTAYVEAVFQPVLHGFSREEALHYVTTLEEFFRPAWQAWFRI